MFEDTMKQNKSIMDAYAAVAEKAKQCAVEEEGAGDLPRTKDEYIKAGEE